MPEAEGDPLEDLKLSNRALNSLKRTSFETVQELIRLSENDLYELRGMGERLVTEIREALELRGLALADNSVAPGRTSGVVQVRHRRRGRHLGRNPAQRRALKRGLVRSLILHSQIETTLARAKEIRRDVDRLITLAKRGDLHARPSGHCPNP